MHRSPTSHLGLLLGLALLVTAVFQASVATSPAAAKTPKCADQVVADWYDDGRISKIYPLLCYRAAIKSLPPDIRDYGNAEEEIGRAWALARQGKQDTGGPDPTPPTGTPTTPTPTTTTPTTPTPTTPTTKTSTSKTTTSKTTTTPTTQTSTETTTSTTDTSGPSAVPVPLLVLGGLAVLLLAAGSAGYLRRRMSGDGSDGDGGTPPTAA